MGAGPRLEPKLQPGPAEDTRLFFDALRVTATRAAWTVVFTVNSLLYTHVNKKKTVFCREKIEEN